MYNQTLNIQIKSLIDICLKNQYIKKILDGDPFPNNPNWYLGAGCICQTVWNYQTSKQPHEGIKDYDLIYYNSTDISYETEDSERQRIAASFGNLPIAIDVINEARVHLWYEEKFGKKIDQYKTCEDAINAWPTTSTSIGIRKIGKEYFVYAPYGLNDLFGMIVRPNKTLITHEIYQKKVDKWTKIWPELKVIPW